MGLPAIALVQMEVKPGRPDLNAERMLAFIAQAREAGAEVVVFSELCISGYILGDLWEMDAYVEDFAGYSDEICRASTELTVIFGNVAVDPVHKGQDGRRRKYNAVYVCANGEYVVREAVPAGLPCGVHPKTLHPNYRFFDDDRHFFSLRHLAEAEGRPLEDWLHPYKVRLKDGRSFSFGVQLCEDMWCEDYCHSGEPLDTLALYRRRGAEAVFNLSSSPFTWQKSDKRNRVVRQILARSPLPFFYVNQVGAQNNGKNIIVFDGDSTAYAPAGTLRAARVRGGNSSCSRAAARSRRPKARSKPSTRASSPGCGTSTMCAAQRASSSLRRAAAWTPAWSVVCWSAPLAQSACLRSTCRRVLTPRLPKTMLARCALR